MELFGSGNVQRVETVEITGTALTREKVQVSVIDGMAVLEGDIVLGPIDQFPAELDAQERDRLALLGTGITGIGLRWPNGTIPFTIASNLPNQARVTNAIAHWQANTFIRFVPRMNERNFVNFMPGQGCSSRVGMVGNRQDILLDAGCGLGNAIHEIGHAVGLFHEQSREDRNHFVTVNASNVQSGMLHNFNQHISDGDDFDRYDYNSIMHYPANAFAQNPSLPTINAPVLIGQRNGLSHGDVSAVATMYGRIHLWHSIRWPGTRPDNGPWQDFRDVEAEAGDRGTIVHSMCAGVSNELHVLAVSSNGHLWHSIRRPGTRPDNGPWQDFRDVEAEVGDIGFVVSAVCAGIGNELHVCAVSSDGHLWHSIRRSDGSWTRFGDVEAVAGDRGYFYRMCSAGVGAELHLCGVTSDGRLWHSVRRSNGSWTMFGDVEAATGDRGVIARIACAGIGNDLHVLAVSGDGRLWHSIRFANGSWQDFRDVEGQTGDRGFLINVGCAGVGQDLHVVGTAMI